MIKKSCESFYIINEQLMYNMTRLAICSERKQQEIIDNPHVGLDEPHRLRFCLHNVMELKRITK